MSGRAYARDAQGFLGGGADLASIVPHTFRIASPKRSRTPRDLAIHQAIRRRCMEKNWKKLIRRRHAREHSDDAAAAESIASTPDTSADADKQQLATDDTSAPTEPTLTEQTSSSDTTAPATSTAEAPTADVASAPVATTSTAETGARKTQPKTDATTDATTDSETITLAKRQLEDLESKLQMLVDRKHAKFVELKTILVLEARSKSSASSTGSTPTPVDKKRRVENRDARAAAVVSNAMSPSSSASDAAPVSPAALSAFATAAAGTTSAATNE